MPRWAKPGHALRPKRPVFGGLPAIVATLLLFAGAIFLITRLDPLPPRFTGTAHAADGDSLRVGGDRVRLLGLDAPELDQVCWTGEGAEWPCGREARTAMAEMLAKGSIDCVTHGEDRFGRFLATCEVAGTDLGAAMVEAGLAISSDAYPREESAARQARRGIWAGRFTNPREWRDEGPTEDPGISLFEQFWTWLRELTGARSLR